jgi:hypothetical protein
VSGAAVAAAAVLIALILDSHAWTQASVSAIRRELAIVWATSRVRAEVAAFAAVVGVTAAVIHVSAQRVTPEAAYGRSLLRWYASQTPVSDSELTSAAGLRVVVFTDYAAVDRHIVPGVINAVAELRARGALVDLVVRHLPGGRECNQEVRIRSDPAGCAAAYAATLVRGAGDEASTFAVGRWLYARGPALTRKIIQQYLEGLGLDKKFEADYASLKESVDRDIRYARHLGVRGTPTFFVNGVRMPAGRGAVERVLEYEFERSQGGPKLGLD